MLRGINQQQIFEDTEDCERFLDILKECKEVCGYDIYAYCLMGNHVHLLIKEGTEPLELIFKRICGKFAYWYNIKYRRIGHLFQDRFKSEPVDTTDYLMTVVRYIHQNPVKAGICKRVSDYEYSSYCEYIGTSYIVDTAYILEIWGMDAFVELNETTVKDNCLDVSEKPVVRVTDEQARALILKIAKCKSVAEFQSLDITKRDKYLKKLREKGVSIRQLSRLTGVSIGVIRKAN